MQILTYIRQVKYHAFSIFSPTKAMFPSSAMLCKYLGILGENH